MSSPKSSNSRGLIRAMLVIGSAQVVNIGLSILRMKVLAVLLGPSGVGLLSIYNNLQVMVSNAAGLGMKSSGVRQLAIAKGEEQALSRVRRVLLAAHLVQGVLAMLGVWLLQEQISVWLLGNTTYALEIALLGIAILLTLLMSAQTALLQGLRRIGDLGRVTVLGALGGTVVGLAAVWGYGQVGLIWFVLAQPLMGLAAALYFTRRLPNPTSPRLSAVETWEIWKPMVRLGGAFMLGGLATTGTLLLVRGLITQDLGLDAAGQFAASWGITMTYVGFLLGAMGADYFPRLTEVIDDRVAASRLMNDQAQLGLAIGGPVLLLLIGWAPWVITLLYSPEFGPAATLLQWQSVGNIFKVASWALSFSIVAGARAKTYFLMELSFNIVFLALIWLLLPIFGLLVTAVAFLLGYVIYFLIVNILVRRIHAFRWQALSLVLLALHAGVGTGLLVLALMAPMAAMIAAPLLALITGLLGLRIVLTKIGPTGRITTQLARVYSALGWPIRSDV
jgi:PST family polysaccharide transporter